MHSSMLEKNIFVYLEGAFLLCNTLIFRYHQSIEKDAIHNTPFSFL